MILPRRYSANAFETVGADTSVSGGTLITAGSSAAKGAYAQLTAATQSAREVCGFIVNIRPITARTLLDIAIDAGGSEKIIVPNISACAGGENFQPLYIPLPIKSASRIAMASSCSTNSGTARALIHLAQGARPVFGRCTTYGADTANVRGQLATAKVATNTEGDWFVITASTTNPIRFMYVMTSAGSVAGAWSGLVGFAVGATGSEVEVIPRMYCRGTSATTLFPFWHGPFEVNIPAGTQLNGRLRASVTVVDVGLSVLAFD